MTLHNKILINKVEYPNPLVFFIDVFLLVAIVFFIINVLTPNDKLDINLPSSTLPLSKDINLYKYSQNNDLLKFDQKTKQWVATVKAGEAIVFPLESDYFKMFPSIINSTDKILVVITGNLLNEIAKFDLLVKKSKTLNPTSLAIYINDQGAFDKAKTIKENRLE